MRAGHQFCQFALALLDWRSPQVFAVQFDQVGDQHRIVTVALMLNEIEHRQTKVVSDDSQAVEQERAHRSALTAATCLQICSPIRILRQRGWPD